MVQPYRMLSQIMAYLAVGPFISKLDNIYLNECVFYMKSRLMNTS